MKTFIKIIVVVLILAAIFAGFFATLPNLAESMNEYYTEQRAAEIDDRQNSAERFTYDRLVGNK